MEISLHSVPLQAHMTMFFLIYLSFNMEDNNKYCNLAYIVVS